MKEMAGYVILLNSGSNYEFRKYERDICWWVMIDISPPLLFSKDMFGLISIKCQPFEGTTTGMN